MIEDLIETLKFFIKCVLVGLVTITFIAALIWSAILIDCYWIFPNHVRSIVPEKIETLKVVTNDANVIFGGGGSCGALAFRLSDKTINEIEKYKLSYFQGAVFAEKSVTFEGYESSWAPWKKLPQDKSSEVTFPVVECGENFEKFVKEKQYQINENTEMYYTEVSIDNLPSGAWMRESLLVIPQFGIIAYSYSNN